MDAAATVVQVRLLCEPALVRRNGALVPLERKDAALLALLALDGSMRRERAAALLWPEVDAQKARNNLRQRLFRLRRTASVDLVEQEASLSLASGLTHDLADLRERVTANPGAAPGELLGGFDYDDCEELDAWVRNARTRVRTLRRDALAAEAARAEAAGEIARALLFAERLVGDDPLSEHAHRLLMRLHYRRGDRAAALSAYARCGLVLKSELRVEPDIETRELAQLIERSGALPGSMARPLPASIAHPPRLIGRDREWQALEVAWSAGRVPLLTGDAGMGKTRLLADFAHAQGVPLVGARPGDERVPYALLARMLRTAMRIETGSPGSAVAPELLAELARVLPELGAAPPGPLGDTRFRHAVTHALAHWRNEAVTGMALDDLHFADLASLEVLPTLTTSGLRWALAVRSGEMPAPLADWEHADGGESLVAIALAPLGESDVHRLLESLALEGIDPAQFAAPISRHTGGNPFFVLETLGALLVRPVRDANALPTTATVDALIERRLEQLTPAALRLARVAALAGIDFEAGLAAAVLEAHPLDLVEAWTELERAQVLRGDGFAHDVIRDVALRSIPGPIGALLHRGIAEVLVERTGAPARIAQHFASAGLWSRAAEFHLSAAQAAQRASRRAEEAEQREAAVRCLDRAGNADGAFEARRDSVECTILVRGVERAQRLIDTMLAAARNDSQRAAALVARANAALMAADHATGVACAREALALAERDGPHALAFDASRLLAVGLAQQGRTDEAEGVLAPFEPRIATEGSPEQRGRYWADLAYVMNSARKLRRTADALSRAMDCARELGDLAELASLTSNLATVHGNLGHTALAHEHALRALALKAEVGETGGPTGGVVEAHVGLYGSALGRYRSALDAFERALACFRQDGQTVWIAVCSNNLAVTWIDLGQFGRARKALAYEQPSVAHVAARGAMLGARVSRCLGTSFAAEIARARDALRRGNDYYIGTLLDLEEAESLPAAEARKRCDAVARTAERRDYGGIAMKARLLATQAALAAGDKSSALARWNEAEGLLATFDPADTYRGRAAEIGRTVLAANASGERAETQLRLALTWLRQTALPQVPEPFHDSFLHRNPTNRSLLSAASRLR